MFMFRWYMKIGIFMFSIKAMLLQIQVQVQLNRSHNIIIDAPS